MRASKLGLLILILAFGGAVETVWSVRHHLELGPAGCRVLGGKFYGSSFSFDEQQRLAVAPGTRIEVVNSFGTVETSLGEPGQLEIALEKVVYHDTQERARAFAANIRMTVQETGSVVQVSTNRDEVRDRASDVGFETHIRLRLPPGTPLRVRNEHGRVEIADAASLDVENSYEPLAVRRIAGEASIKSRHGDVTVEAIQGALSLGARYGDVEVRDVTGPMSFELEHGNASMSRLASLSATQSYGELTLEDVAGEVQIRGEHLSVNASQIGGRAVIETGYRDVSLSGVTGEVSVTAEHSEVSVSDARGAVYVRTSYEDASLAGIAGPADVTVDHGGLRAERLAGGIRARVVGDDVLLDGFRGAVDVEASRADVHLVPDAAFSDAVRVSVRNGGIRFEVPAESRFDLEAVVKRGQIEVNDVPGFTLTQSSPERIAGRMGEGGLDVKLEADQGDVSLEPRALLEAKQR